MIPAMKKQIDRANRYEYGWFGLPLSDNSSQLSVEVLDQLKNDKEIWCKYSEVTKQIPARIDTSAAQRYIKGDNPFAGGRAWYGNYTGPGNKRSDWEEDHLPPLTPLDRGPMQHDQEYSNLEEYYGYDTYRTESNKGKEISGTVERWGLSNRNEGSFWKMRLDTDNEHLHISLIEADARLMWRSAWYTVEGIWEGKYDLTFSKGPKGALNLFTDIAVASVIIYVFPYLIALDAAFLGITIGRHIIEASGQMAVTIGNDLKQVATDFRNQISTGTKYYSRQVLRGTSYYGNKLNQEVKSAGQNFSDWYINTRGNVSSGFKRAGDKLSDTWKKADGTLDDGWRRVTGAKGGGCFLTTAAVRSLSIETGERVLVTLRAFRDDVLLESEQGKELVGAYYAIAPQIVACIDASRDGADEYERIYREIVLPCYQLIRSGDSIAAVDVYSRGVYDLAAKWFMKAPACKQVDMSLSRSANRAG